MKKKRKVGVKINPLDLIKETPEQRKQRVRESGNAYRTKVVESKKQYNRQQYKKGE
jgi:hypothetical protein